MPNLRQLAAAAVLAPATLIAAGCTTTEQFESLRTEVSAVRNDLQALRSELLQSQKAAQDAADAAARAAAEAKAASETADRIYRQSLRK